VDLGIKETALVHISEMSDRFVKDPLETVKVGDVMEFKVISIDTERRRIGLSLKKGLGNGNQGLGTRDWGIGNSDQKVGGRNQRDQGSKSRDQRTRSEVKKHSMVSKCSSPEQRPQSPVPSPQSPNDGTMYNPFAEAFRKARERK
jgi:uncharacterized protein